RGAPGRAAGRRPAAGQASVVRRGRRRRRPCPCRGVRPDRAARGHERPGGDGPVHAERAARAPAPCGRATAALPGARVPPGPGAGPGRPYSHRYRWLAPHPEPVRGAAWRPHCRPRARPRQRRASPSAGERGAMTTPRCRPTRTLLLYAQDNQGLGHVTRALTIARHLLAAYPDTVAYIATKSPVASHFRLPERCDYIKLPTLLAPAGLARTPAEEEAAKQHFRAIRGEILRDVALGLAPDLVLVDHEPLGSKGEFRDGLCALKAARPHTRFIFGLRDIMDDAARIRATWQEMGVYEAFEQLYDGIAVYGSSRLYNVADAYAIPASVQTKLEYCGYIVRDPPAEEESGALRQRYGLPPAGPLVVATVGSGSDGYPVLAAARAALDRMRARHPQLVAILVTGPFMPA